MLGDRGGSKEANLKLTDSLVHGGEKWQDTGYILKVELRGLADKTDLEYGKKKGTRGSSKVFGLGLERCGVNNWCGGCQPWCFGTLVFIGSDGGPSSRDPWCWEIFFVSAADRIKSSFKFLYVLLKPSHFIIPVGIISTLTFVVLWI